MGHIADAVTNRFPALPTGDLPNRNKPLTRRVGHRTTTWRETRSWRRERPRLPLFRRIPSLARRQRFGPQSSLHRADWWL